MSSNVSSSEFEDIITKTSGIGAACFNTLKSFGYSYDDALQEGYYWMFEYLVKGGTIDNPRAWLKTVLRNKEINRIDSSANKVFRHAESIDPFDRGRTFPVDVDDSGDGFEEIIKPLPEEQKILLRLFYVSRCTTTELSAMMGIPKATVKTRIYRAIKRLRT